MPRQTGKSTTVVSYLLHYAIFNDSVNIGILGKQSSQQPRELLARLGNLYENLPKWMHKGILVWNKGNIELENGSKIIASTSASAVRGMSFNILFLDEFAFVPNHIVDSFFICLSYYHFR